MSTPEESMLDPQSENHPFLVMPTETGSHYVYIPLTEKCKDAMCFRSMIARNPLGNHHLSVVDEVRCRANIDQAAGIRVLHEDAIEDTYARVGNHADDVAFLRRVRNEHPLIIPAYHKVLPGMYKRVDRSTHMEERVSKVICVMYPNGDASIPPGVVWKVHMLGAVGMASVTTPRTSLMAYLDAPLNCELGADEQCLNGEATLCVACGRYACGYKHTSDHTGMLCLQCAPDDPDMPDPPF